MDGDGLDDLLIASFRGYDGGHNAGKVHLVLGGSLTDSPRDIRLGTDDIVFGGEEDGWAGYDLSTAGDIDGDGLSDILIGSPQLNAGPGRAYLVRGH